MKKPVGKRFLLLGLLPALIGVTYFLAALDLAWARPHRVGRIPDTKLGCGACHVSPAGGGPRNSFGRDYELVGIGSGDKYTDKLGNKDSDGDGYSNAQEFAGGTHPGDPGSKPSK